MKYNLKKENLTIFASLLLINSSLIFTGCSIHNSNSIVESSYSKNSSNNESDDNTDYIYNEKSYDEIIIEYYQNTENEIQNMLQSDDSNIKQNVSEKVVILVDFLFYNGEIKGITVSDISDEVKEELTLVTTTIDEKIENKFPNYKEKMSDKFTVALNFIKEKGNGAINKIDSFLEEKIDNYDDIKDVASSIASSTKDGVNELTDLAKYNFSKVKNYYENWRDDVKTNSK